MQKAVGSLSVIAAVFIAVFYLAHLYKNYEKIQSELAKQTAQVVHPVMNDGDISDAGYIYEMRRDEYVREGRLNLVWFVVVPETNVHYSCSYEAGFPDFKMGDSVRLIHTKNKDQGDYGYIIGLHEKTQGKMTMIWTFDLDAANFDLPDDE